MSSCSTRCDNGQVSGFEQPAVTLAIMDVGSVEARAVVIGVIPVPAASRRIPGTARLTMRLAPAK
jgi:hypothetical protein